MAQAAERLKLTEATLRRALEQGLLEGERREGVWWVARDAIAHFERHPELRLQLPLTADDILCAECGELPARCTCH